MLKTPKFYYPALDGLRFFAFLLIFLHFSLRSYTSDNFLLSAIILFIKKNGWIGVDLFLVLSGFLITSLLLTERKKYGHFSIKNFLIRRILRIAPLYLLALLVASLLIISHPPVASQFDTQLPLFLIFLGNWAVTIPDYINIKYLSHLWTISMEIQFYLIWCPILLFVTSLKKGLFIGAIIITIAILIRIFLISLNPDHPGIYTHTFARLDTFVLGAILSMFMFYSKSFFKKISIFTSVPILTLSVILFIYFLYLVTIVDPKDLRNGAFGYLAIALFMTYFLIITISKHALFYKLLSYQPLVWLGKISYGLYVWQVLAIEATDNPLTAFLLVVLIAAASYYFYEINFLKMKSSFTKIVSRPI